MKHIYKGSFTQDNWYQVTIDGVLFDPKPSQKIRNHSPDGFAWGYNGSGPAQLALAILLKETDGDSAQRLYQEFKREIISILPQDEWILHSHQVHNWINSYAKTTTAT